MSFLPGDVVTADALNKLVDRTAYASVTPPESTSSETYVDLDTRGPTVSVDTGARAIVIVHAWIAQSAGAGVFALMSHAVSGASTRDTEEFGAAVASSASPDKPQTMTGIRIHQSLNAGVNTFTAKYRQKGLSVASFQRRTLIVIPLP